MRLKFSKKENSDSALAMLLLMLLARIFFNVPIADVVLVLILVFAMAVPYVFYPFTLVWLNFSDFLGKVMSNVLLFIIYALIVVPIAMIRKLLGKDRLNLKGYKKSGESVFFTRNHTFTKQDINAPY